ncbi:hypothetical protein DFJ73DRAFT_760233 [Zopfochytrium polystomum]|nr:hypothetical protein DFJ73DRAFT_760233 [Zopfochytrium polystomum]
MFYYRGRWGLGLHNPPALLSSLDYPHPELGKQQSVAFAGQLSVATGASRAEIQWSSGAIAEVGCTFQIHQGHGVRPRPVVRTSGADLVDAEGAVGKNAADSEGEAGAAVVLLATTLVGARAATKRRVGGVDRACCAERRTASHNGGIRVIHHEWETL